MLSNIVWYSASMFTYSHKRPGKIPTNAMEIIPWAVLYKRVGGRGKNSHSISGLLYKRVGGRGGEKNGHSSSDLLYKRVGGGKKMATYSTSGLLYKRVGGVKKMATVHRAYSTREWGGGKKNGHSTSGLLYRRVGGEKMATVHRAYSTRECHCPKAGVESEFQGGDFCFYSSTGTAIAVLFVPNVVRMRVTFTRGNIIKKIINFKFLF